MRSWRREWPTASLALWGFAGGAAASVALRPAALLALAGGGAAAAVATAAGARAVAMVALAAGLGLAVGAGRVEQLRADPFGQRIGTSLHGDVVVAGEWGGPAPRWRAEGELAPDGGRVLVRLTAQHPPPRGSILRVHGVLRRPRAPSGGYDEGAILARHGIRAVLHVERWQAVGRRGGVLGVLDGVRARSLAAYGAAGADDAGRLLGALTLGADAELSTRTRDDFRRSGLAHLLAVSGGNVALLAAFVLVAAWVAGAGRAVAHGLTIGAIAAYVGVVGASPSVVRAGVAGVLAAAAWLLSRPTDRWHLYAAGLAVLLARNPLDLLDPGAQLSFAAVAAILLVVPRLQRWLDGTPCPPLLAAPVALSAACTLATAPIAWWHFGAANLLASVPANVLAAPAVPLILWLGVLAAGLDPVLPVAADGCAALARLPCRYLLGVARAGASLDAAVPAWALGALAGLALALVIARLARVPAARR